MRLMKTSTLAAVFFLLVTVPGTQAQSRDEATDRDAILKDLDSLRTQIAEKEAAFLAPSAEDAAKYAEFLKTPNTGLCRLMPGDKYVKAMTVRGGGAYYSFMKLTHEYGYGSEIGLGGDGKLNTVFAGADLGLIASLGDIPLEAVGLENPAASFLLSYQPPSIEKEARAEYWRINSGLEVGPYTFNRSAIAKTSTTYVLRNVEYENRDLITAVRIVGQDSDGSITILWKILKENPKPALIRSEN